MSLTLPARHRAEGVHHARVRRDRYVDRRIVGGARFDSADVDPLGLRCVPSEHGLDETGDAGQVEPGGATRTNEQYVVSPHTTASQASRETTPPGTLAKPHGNFPRAADIFAFADCWPSSLANAVDPMPMTMHWPVFGIQDLRR